MTANKDGLELRQSPHSPPLDALFRGVRIALGPTAPGAGLPRLYGSIQLESAQAKSLGVVPIQRAVVLASSSDLITGAVNLLGERLAFPDDQSEAKGIVRAFFSVELAPYCPRVDGWPSYVVVSVGPFISNVLTLPPVAARP